MTIAKTVARLDYSKPPPGYYDDWLGQIANVRRWAQYKAHNDPPGFSRGGAALICWPGNGVLVMFARPRIQASRTAAWAWYDRRDALADSLSMVTMSSSAGVRTPFWPRILTWTDEQVAEVERWLRDNTAEMPEVLRG